MDNLEKINKIPFLDLFSKIGIQTAKDTTLNEYRLSVPGEARISNGSYKVNTIKNVVYANGNTRPQGTVFSFMKIHLNAINDRDVFAWFEENFGIKTEKEVKKANILKKVILEKFSDYRIRVFDEQILGNIRTWLVHRGFSHEYVNSEEGTQRIKTVFSIC